MIMVILILYYLFLIHQYYNLKADKVNYLYYKYDLITYHIYNNDIIIDYDWYSLFNEYNKVCNRDNRDIKLTGIYIDWTGSVDRGPILVTYNIHTRMYIYKYFDITAIRNIPLKTPNDINSIMTNHIKYIISIV